MSCRYRTQQDQTITHTPDYSGGIKGRVIVRCNGEWHIREPYTDRHGRLKGSAVICMCPDFNERWSSFIKREYDISGWTHVSLKNRRV